ncbi:hypothetical protein J2129_001129 [Methanofollis sp. W23]|uniref:hypothetical protein n=1 Tax=Methanofollis sp. W23 TaxID=2817849 RepID=UPI001AE4B26B|nr:hypothetical protein [Methanofollis sp. W23]MBP2145675.1 hypothetical protein [Methanofollis sp. W23]
MKILGDCQEGKKRTVRISMCGDGGDGCTGGFGPYFDGFPVDDFPEISGFVLDLLCFGVVVGDVFVPVFLSFDSFDPDEGFHILN